MGKRKRPKGYVTFSEPTRRLSGILGTRGRHFSQDEEQETTDLFSNEF